MNTDRKKPEADLKRYYTLFLELGLIMTLLVFITAAKVTIVANEQHVDLSQEQEVVKMEEMIQTEQKKEVPPPERPQVPVEVPDDQIIEDDIIDLNSDLDLSEALSLPPPPVEEEEDVPDFHVAVEKNPELIGGLQKLQEKMSYTDQARRAGIEGQITIAFTVNLDGSVQDPEIIRGLKGGLNEVAIEGLMKHARFRPGMQNGRPVRVRYSLPIIFRLTNR